MVSFKGKISKDHRSRCMRMHNGDDIIVVGPNNTGASREEDVGKM
jgi:hypothetical protein